MRHGRTHHGRKTADGSPLANNPGWSATRKSRKEDRVSRKNVCSLVGASLAVMLLVSGCCTQTPVIGGIITMASYPHTQAVGPGARGSKEGDSSVVTLLGLLCVGDASVERAARRAGISKIATVDHTMINILGMYIEYRTIVTGE
jgi:hypothetical protein